MEIDNFEKDGFCGPFDLDDPNIITPLLQRVLSENSFQPVNDSIKRKHILGANKEIPLVLANSHTTNPLVMSLGQDRAILDRLGQLMGNEIYLRRSQFWRKTAQSRGIMWHQDTHRRMGLGDVGEFSAWVALEDSYIDNGCVWLLRGSHKAGIIEPNSIATPAFRIRFFASEKIETPPALEKYEIVPMKVKKGQFFIFHQLCFHASGPNKTEASRTGLVYRYLTDPNIQTVKEELTRVV